MKWKGSSKGNQEGGFGVSWGVQRHGAKSLKKERILVRLVVVLAVGGGIRIGGVLGQREGREGENGKNTQ